jgi:predicted DNA-binding ribbon-helix-helix protein
MLVKRSVSLAGHRTSIALEPEFWAEVERLAKDNGVSLAAFIRTIDEGRAPESNLASQLRLAVLADLNTQLVRQDRMSAAPTEV